MTRRVRWLFWLQIVLVLMGLVLGGAPVPEAGAAERAAANNGSILAEIRRRGYVTCGFRTANGFTAVNEYGQLSGFMVDFCRAVAAAALGDSNAFRPERLPDKPQEFNAVERLDVDVAFQTTTWTLSRETQFAIAFTVPIFYDGQGFAQWSDNAASGRASSRNVCVKAATTSLQNLEDYLKQHDRPWTVRVFRNYEEAIQAFLGRECDIITTDRSMLLTSLARYRGIGLPITIFPDSISREPFTPYVPAGDSQWLDIVRWSIYATILAEESRLSIGTIGQARPDGTPERDLLLGRLPKAGQALGLADDWALKIVQQVGSYADIFNRNLGAASPYQMDRGVNRPWSEGGLLFAPPVR